MSARPACAELLDEVHAHAAGHEGEDRFGLQGGDLRELGLEVERVERNVDFLDDLALVVALEAGERVLAGLIVRRQR